MLRRFTFTEYNDDGRRDPVADAYSQWDKLNSAYPVAEWFEPLFNNRALFSDYYLNQRLPDLDEWNAPERNRAFRRVRGQFAQARRRFADADTFEDLSERGKWESSLWKDPACRPYVDQESRSTRHLEGLLRGLRLYAGGQDQRHGADPRRPPRAPPALQAPGRAHRVHG